MPDFGFVGPAYEAPALNQDAQRSINYYVEMDRQQDAKTPKALLSAPGKATVATLFAGAPVRGCWVLPGGTQSLWVCDSHVYLMSVATPASGTGQATFTAVNVGTIQSSVGPVSIRDNASGGIAVIVDGLAAYYYVIATQTLAQITDANFPVTANRVAFIDGWFIFNVPGTQQFSTPGIPYWTGSTAYWPSTPYYALKDSSTDNLMTMIEHQRELWLVGEKTTEVWYDAGGASFAFSRLQGALLQVGCSAYATIDRFGDGLIWLGRNTRGENIVVKTSGYQYEAVSNHAISNAIATYPYIADAIGYTYQEAAHEFYVLTFPTADVTWVYDGVSGEWHQRASFDPIAGQFHRDRGNCYCDFQNQRLVGDYANGQVYQMSRQIYTDGPAPLVGLRRAPHVWAKDERVRVFHSQLQIEFRAGMGSATGQGANPQAMLRWSNDGGQTWSGEHWTGIGAQGATRNRAIWRRLGQARDRVYELRVTDPVPRDIVGATLMAEAQA